MGRNSITEGAYLYALNLKTGKKKFMLDGVSAVYVVGKKVIPNTNEGNVESYPIKVFRENGTGKKVLANGAFIKIKKNRVYYLVVRKRNKKSRYKVYSCDLNGKHKKAVTGWFKDILGPYYPD